jgi:hypothetical protein
MKDVFIAAVVVLSLGAAGNKYATPEKAVDAFVSALRGDNEIALIAIFGRDSQSLFDSGDPVADRNLRTALLARYEAKHSLAPGDNGSRVLFLGQDQWPFPIPLIASGDGWRFHTAAGLDDVIDRRIERNERDAINSCLAIAEAENTYYSADRDGDGVLEYASKFRSSAGRHDGLYWQPAEGEAPSPLEAWITAAADEGYAIDSDTFHGYQYELLSAQGRFAPGGAYDYAADGHQVGGFALLAFPVSYADTGVMTFIVSHSGSVYQSDLGPHTRDEVMKIHAFDPGPGWTKVIEKNPALVAER